MVPSEKKYCVDIDMYRETEKQMNWFGNQRHDFGIDRERAPMCRTAQRIISYVQAQSFKREIATLTSDKFNKRTSYGEVSKTSSLYRLSPMLSAQSLLCVHGWQAGT